MSRRARWVVIASVAAAFVVFLVIQDRITAQGASEYVERQRAAVVGQTPDVTLDEVMRPAVRRSVRMGVLWSGVVLIVGLAASAVVNGVDRRRRP